MLFFQQIRRQKYLFEGLSIWREEQYRALQGTFPVIFLSFAPIKSGKIEEMKKVIKIILSNLYGEYRHIMKSKLFDDNDREGFASVNEKMDEVTAYAAINRLCIYLAKYYQKDVIVILDEYDTPMQESWLAGTWDETVDFFRNFFNHTFKTNPYLYRGRITGITQISKESIFSDLNNLKVATTTSNKFDRNKDCAYIIEFKVHKPLKEQNLEETVANAHVQIKDKKYEAELVSMGFHVEQIRKYGFAFQGKTCLIG